MTIDTGKCKSVPSIQELFNAWNRDTNIGSSSFMKHMQLYGSIMIQASELFKIICFVKDYLYHDLSRCNKIYNVDFSDFNKWLQEKMNDNISKAENPEPKALWEKYIGTLLNEIRYKLMDINDSCKTGSTNAECLHSNSLNIIFSLCFPLLVTVVLTFYFLFNKLLRKYIEDRNSFRNRDYVTLDSAKKRINMLYLLSENS
ncbi:variable surface protein [Plasmodium gonderi]|uniref:Variable surface protein n=1 Tax=Plasmodium gonderi TaxID=77519 RepID=A0A1Y1JQY8_PLAGO|nr:variable surface protein [Plasmodium gonderi]GAW83918.1 variable surface protein [Plasmodium gonderi]